MTIKTNFFGISNNGPKQLAITERACDAIATAVNDPDFMSRVSSASYQSTQFLRANGEKVLVPAADIYSYVMLGLERDTEADRTIDLSIELSYHATVLGSTEIGKLPIRTSFNFINKCISRGDYISLAAHYMHQWLHVCGFQHTEDGSVYGDVPFTVGMIVRDILSQLDPVLGSDTGPDSAAYALLYGHCAAHIGDLPDETPPPDASSLRI